MKIKETLDQNKFPTRRLKDIGIEKIRKLEECIDDETAFMEIIQELCDKTIWLSVTSKDLYYWIEVLNKVDIIMEKTIEEVKQISNGTQRFESESEFDQIYRRKCEKLCTLLTFSANLLRESSSRSIYNSVDRLIDILKEVDDLEVIYLALEAAYALIRKSCLTGKFTKAHEIKENDLLKLVYMYALGLNFLSDIKIDLSNCMDLSTVLHDKEIVLQRFKKIKKGQREIPSLSYFRVTCEEIHKVELPENKPKTAKNLAVHFEKENELGNYLIEPLKMKILFAFSLLDPAHASNNLVTINKIALKAKSVFIHLSVAEENDVSFTTKFVKEFPFNEFIPNILSFCTIQVPTVLH